MALLSGTWGCVPSKAEAGEQLTGSTAGIPGGVAGVNGSANNSNGGGAGAGASAGGVSVLGVPCALTRDEAARVVSQTAYAESSEDTCAAALKELSPESAAGVWQEFALLNHSCAPNTCAALFGATLVVRAVAPVLAGEELTTCYLGQQRLAPVRARRAALRAAYGFHCQCERCVAEQRAFPTNWYPQDASLLGLVDTSQTANGGGGGAAGSGGGDGSEGGTGGAEGGGPLGAAVGAWRSVQDWFGFGAAAAARPAPSLDNFALLELYEAAAPGSSLASEVQAAAAAPGRRVAVQRRAAALARLAAGRARLGRALDGLPRAPGAAERRWLAAAAFCHLQLEADAVDLFLSGGAIPSEKDILDGGGAPRGRRRGGPLFGWLRGAAGDGDALGPAEDEECAEAAARRALRARQAVALLAAADALDGVGRGSEPHLQLAVAALDVVRALHGSGSPQVRAAELACGKAHMARYGRLGAEVLSAAVAARRKQLLGASLSRRMSMLAWDTGEK